MTCIKTGGNVYLQSHGAVVHGDLYMLEAALGSNVYAFRYMGERAWYYPHDDEATTVNLIVTGDFMDINDVLVFPDISCGDFDYDGVEL